jgi:hypothetical protein
MPTPTIGYYGEKLNLQIRQGATLGPFSATMKNADGSAVNLTNCTIRGKIRKTALSATVTATLDCSITNAAAGQYQFGLTDEVTAAITCGEKLTDKASQYVWDLELEDSTGRVVPLYYGDCLVLREVTR